MEYGAEILRGVTSLHGDVGGLKAEMAALRRDFDRAREESSERYEEATERLESRLQSVEAQVCGLSESSDARKAELSAEMSDLRDMVLERRDVHVDPDDTLARMMKEDEAEVAKDKAAKRGFLGGLSAFLKGLGALLLAGAGAVSAWWATHKG